MRALLLVVAVACTTASEDALPTDEHGAPLPQAGTAVLRPETVVLPADVAKAAIVEWDHVIVPAGVALRPRDVIVSAAGDGFIRRAITIVDQGDTLRVTTSPATLAEAVTSATFATTIDESLAIDQRIDGNLDILTASANGMLAVDSSVDIELAVDDGVLSSFGLAIAGSGDARVEGTLAFTSTEHRSWGEVNELDETIFRRKFALGPLPIVVVGRVRGVLAANAYVEQPVTFASGARGPITFDATTAFTPETGWTASNTSDFAAASIGPTLAGDGSASLSIGITARFELAFYGVAGPSVVYSAQATSVGLRCNTTPITALQAGLFGDAVFELQPLAAMQRAVVPLWNSRVALDPLETCTP